jgi:alkylhydroperoxidase family enzyme
MAAPPEREVNMPGPSNYTSKVAVPLPPEGEIRRVMGPSYDPKTTLNVLQMFAGAGDMYAATVGLVNAIFVTQGISPKSREMIILRSAKVLNCPYEWQANVVFARNVGLSDAEISAVSADGPVTGVDPEYILLCRATDELSTTGTLTDATLAEMLKRYDETTVRKLNLMIAWFNLLPRFLNACRVPLETTDKVGQRSSPL